MRTTVCVPLTACLLLAAGSARADDQGEARKVIDKAIQAAGGEAKLARLKGLTWKSKGDYHGMGAAIPYTASRAIEWPDRSRMELEFDAGGMKVTFVQVFNKDKGWRKLNDLTMELTPEEVQEAQEGLYAGRVAQLLPLKDKAHTLSLIGEAKVNEKPAMGVKVSSKGHRDVDLYFDKETGLLVKAEHQVKEMGQEQKQETLYRDYKEVEGIKHPFKLTIKRDGQLYVEDEATEFKPVEKLDHALFNKP